MSKDHPLQPKATALITRLDSLYALVEGKEPTFNTPTAIQFDENAGSCLKLQNIPQPVKTTLRGFVAETIGEHAYSMKDNGYLFIPLDRTTPEKMNALIEKVEHYTGSLHGVDKATKEFNKAVDGALPAEAIAAGQHLIDGMTLPANFKRKLVKPSQDGLPELHDMIKKPVLQAADDFNVMTRDFSSEEKQSVAIRMLGNLNLPDHFKSTLMTRATNIISTPGLPGHN